MDIKIKKYALYLKITAWILVVMHIWQWIAKWFADLIIYCMANHGFGRGLDLSMYSSLAEAYEKLPSDKLALLKLFDVGMGARYGAGWIGLDRLASLSWTFRFLGFLCDGISVGILIFGFYFFIKLMVQFRYGANFSADVIDLLSKLAKVIFWFALYSPISRALVNLIIAFQNPRIINGQHLFVSGITLGDIVIFAASWFFVILTSLMYQSRELQTDRDLTI